MCALFPYLVPNPSVGVNSSGSVIANFISRPDAIGHLFLPFRHLLLHVLFRYASFLYVSAYC